MDKVSIIVPTRDRDDTLASCLATIAWQTYSHYEVIVSDNGRADTTRVLVTGLNDDRFRCVKPPRPLSMAHNFEFALSHADGDWLVVLGDDDGLMPSGIERGLRMLAASGSEALGSLTGRYRWPDHRPGGAEALLSVPTSRGWEWRDSRQAMRRILTRDMSINDTPMTYTGGIVARSLFDRIKRMSGTFFHSQIPDCYSSFAMLSVLDRYVFCREPLMIAGISGHSHGQVSLNLVENAFNRDENIPIHDALTLPEEKTFTFSMQIILFESYLQSEFLRATSDATDVEEQVVAASAYAKWIRGRSAGSERAYQASRRWSQAMCARYGLDEARVADRSKRLTTGQAVSQYRQFASDFLGRYVVRGSSDAIADVADAAAVAERIFLQRPATLPNHARSIARAVASRLS